MFFNINPVKMLRHMRDSILVANKNDGRSYIFREEMEMID